MNKCLENSFLIEARLTNKTEKAQEIAFQWMHMPLNSLLIQSNLLSQYLNSKLSLTQWETNNQIVSWRPNPQPEAMLNSPVNSSKFLHLTTNRIKEPMLPRHHGKTPEDLLAAFPNVYPLTAALAAFKRRFLKRWWTSSITTSLKRPSERAKMNQSSGLVLTS